MVQLTPACKSYLWGGTRLRQKYHIGSTLTPLAEAWVLSCHPDGPSRLPDGTPLPRYLADNPGLVGSCWGGAETFPLLIKLIDAKENLSVQVHPTDAYAVRHGERCGKNELWIVLDCEPGAFIYYGFQRSLTKKEFEKHLRQNTLTDVLRQVFVRRGDAFFIPAGTVHAIGRGIVIAEIQQNSNTTYRIYDYGRLGPGGQPRELHWEQAMEVADLHPCTVSPRSGHLGQCAQFTVDRFSGPFAAAVDEASFLHLLAVEGQGVLCQDGQTLPVHSGSSIFLAAGSGPFTVTGSVSVLCTRPVH